MITNRDSSQEEQSEVSGVVLSRTGDMLSDRVNQLSGLYLTSNMHSDTSSFDTSLRQDFYNYKDDKDNLRFRFKGDIWTQQGWSNMDCYLLFASTQDVNSGLSISGNGLDALRTYCGIRINRGQVSIVSDRAPTQSTDIYLEGDSTHTLEVRFTIADLQIWLDKIQIGSIGTGLTEFSMPTDIYYSFIFLIRSAIGNSVNMELTNYNLI